MLEQLAMRGEPTLALGERDVLVVCVVGNDITALFEKLRERTARDSVRALGRDQGYRIEDAVRIVLAAESDATRLAAWLRRRLAREVIVIERPGPIAIAAELAARVGGSPERVTYARDTEGRVRVEAFELHVAEHCNLRCANCCNMSPLVDKRILSVADVEALAAQMATVLHADVVKIMGGEPLLHPEIAQVIRVLRKSGIGDRVRLFTNGLLLAAQGDDFWEALDELTISHYISAPVKPAILDMVRARAQRHDIVLNIKPVAEFSQVLSPSYQADTDEMFARCWLRHRCLVVRDRKF